MSSNVAIYDGNPIFVEGSTPFGFYDNDAQFQKDAVRVAKFCGTRLGYPILDVELQSGSMFACFEEAVTEYGNAVYSWKVKENYLSLEGGSKDIDANNMVVEPTLQRIVEIAKNYGTEADVGGNVQKQVGLLDVKAGQQTYDLNVWASSQGIQGGIEIRKIFYEAPPAILRYFDPYAGTGTGVQSLMDAFDFGSYSPGVNFLLMPISADLLKIQAIEFNDQVRRSAYSFRVSNNQLELFPIPTQDGKLRIEYYKLSDKRKLNPAAESVSTTAVHRMDYDATADETVTFTHNLGTRDVTVQVYQTTTVEGVDRSYMIIPQSVSVIDGNSLSVTFQCATKGFILISYQTLKTSVDGTTAFLGYSADFDVVVPEGQTSYTQKFVHTLDTTELSVQVYEDVGNNSNMIIPGDVRIVNAHEIDITFTQNCKGHVVLSGTFAESITDSNVITNISEVPYQNPTYSKINSIGRQWIFRYTLALCKEVLAYVRGKYQQLPVPGSETTLNHGDLLADARSEKEALLKELNDTLDITSRQSQLERKAKEAEYLRGVLTSIPTMVYIG